MNRNAQRTAQRPAPRRIATRNGQPAWQSPAPRERAPVPMAQWLARPRRSPLSALIAPILARLTGARSGDDA